MWGLNQRKSLFSRGIRIGYACERGEFSGFIAAQLAEQSHPTGLAFSPQRRMSCSPNDFESAIDEQFAERVIAKELVVRHRIDRVPTISEYTEL